MKAWTVQRLGEPAEVMTIGDVAEPVVGDDQLLVQVRSCSLGFPDALMCRGEYQLRHALPFVPGVEVVGDVLRAPATSGWAPGDRVSGLTASLSGGLGEQVALAVASTTSALPQLDDAEAASFFGVYQTAWMGLHRRADIAPGDVVLVTAAAGGVGSAAVQLGVAAGARVIGVTRGAEKSAVVSGLGAELVIDRDREDIAETVLRATNGLGADIVFDSVGGDAFVAATKCIAFEGRILVVGFASGQIPTLGVNRPLLKNYSIIGLNNAHYIVRNPQLVRHAYAELKRLVEQTGMRPLVGRRVAFDDAAAALQDLADGRTVGRSVVTLAS